MIGILHNIPCLFRASCTEVDGIHHFRTGFLRPVCKFMKPDFIGFRGEPGQVKPLRSVFHRSDAVLPVEAGYKITAGITHNRDSELLYRINDIRAKTGFVRQRMTGFINASVYRPAQMFDKGPENPVINSADLIILIQYYFCLFHQIILSRCRK